MNQRVVFSSRDSVFRKSVRARVDAYFAATGLRKRGHWLLPFKSFLFLSLMGVFYAAILLDRFGGIANIALACGFGFASVFFVFNTAHDGSHGTYSEHRWINQIAARAWWMVGLHSYGWNLKHNRTHHTFTNVEKVDIDIEGGGLLRLDPSDPWLPFHRYQHIYAYPLYSLISLITVFVQSPMWLFRKRWGNLTIKSTPRSAWVEAAFALTFYATYTLVVPIVVLNYPWWQTLLGYIAMHAVIGQVMTFILVTVHVAEGVGFGRPDRNGRLGDWMTHQLETTVDLAADNRLVTFLCGGLNTHVAHHLFPNICHVHTKALTDIIRRTAAEHQLCYRNYGLAAGFRAHMRALRSLGQPDSRQVILSERSEVPEGSHQAKPEEHAAHEAPAT